MIQNNFNLERLNTFGVKAMAEHYFLLDSLVQLPDLKNLPAPIFYLGKGSNVLFTEDYQGSVLHNCLKGIECIEEDDEMILLRAFAGEDWHQFVAYTLENNWFGLECLAYIPSSVGATPVQNIGAYGVEVKDLIECVHVYNIKTGQHEIYSKNECQFGYRDSIFKSDLKDRLVLSVDYRLSKAPTQYQKLYPAVEEYLAVNGIKEFTPQDIFHAVVAIRQSKLPEVTEIRSAGSFFKNPVIPKKQVAALRLKYPKLITYPYDDQCIKLSAGQIIDMLGFKGQYVDNVGMYEKQALILVNLGGATGQLLFEHSQKVMKEVEHKLGICLEPEVIIL